jgi:hypothetical protein
LVLSDKETKQRKRWVRQKHGARKSHGCVNPSFSRILTRTRFAPYALGQALFARQPARPHVLSRLRFLVDSLSGLRCVVCVEWFALKGQSGQLRVSQPDVYLLLQFLVSWLVCCMEFMGYGLPYFGGLVSWWVGGVVRSAYKFGGWLSADSAGCPLGRFNHWWRSVWVSVFGEGGFHTSSALASTVLLGHL